MKNIITLFVMLLLFISSSILAQLTVKDQEPSPNTLFEVIDEGISGSVLLPPLSSTPGNVDQKLFNVLGELYWNGNKVGNSFSAAGWTYDGTNILTSNVNDKVGIGMNSAPSVKLSLGTNISPKKLALFDGPSDFYGFGVDWGRITIYTNNTEKMTIKENGNVGINVTNPQAKLDIDGDVKIGTSGVKFSEIYELTGTTGVAGTYMIIVPYPTGYNQENTRGLSLAIQFSPGYWWSMGYIDNNARSIHYILGVEGIVIHYPLFNFVSKPFRMVLMKVE